MDAKELSALQLDLELPADDVPYGFMSYLDVLWRERVLFVSLHHQRQRLDRLIRPLDHPYALAECVLRPALVDVAGPQEGFAVTLYVKAGGTNAAEAYTYWASAL